MRRPVQHPKASVGLDAAAFIAWCRAFTEQLVQPLRHLTIDFSRKDGPVAQHDRFLAEKAVAASGVHGCRRAQSRVRIATLRGLAHAVGRPLPPEIIT